MTARLITEVYIVKNMQVRYSYIDLYYKNIEWYIFESLVIFYFKRLSLLQYI